MLLFYMKGENDIQTIEQIRAVYGEGALAEKKNVQKWFASFETGDFILEE